MLPRFAFLAVLFLLSCGASAQDADAAMQNLLAGLTRGTEVALYTPLGYGMLEVTRFTPPVALPRSEAEAAVVVARQQLRMLDIPAPTGGQLARALVGGTIEMRDGPQRLPGVLPLTGSPPIVTTAIVLVGAPPLSGNAPAPAAAAGGSVAPSYPTR